MDVAKTTINIEGFLHSNGAICYGFAPMKEFGDIVETGDGSLTLRHPEHQEEYHSRLGARREAWDLYIARSGILESLEKPESLAVLDVGLGLAYNALSTLDAWLSTPNAANLSIISLEISPSLPEALKNDTAPWTKNWPTSWQAFAAQLRDDPSGFKGTVTHPNGAHAHWRIVIGNALELDLSLLEGSFDYFWQDPFSPQKNPDMWSASWFGRLKTVATKDAVLMTYSVARTVKDALESGGWRHTKLAATGSKRHWLKATPTLPDDKQDPLRQHMGSK